MKNLLILAFCFFLFLENGTAQFAPPAGQPGSTAIHKDSSIFIGWATTCEVLRGPMDLTNPQLGNASAGADSMAVGKAGDSGTVSLGDGGVATLSFSPPITNGNGFDFAVFENSFSDSFLELAFVEVSSDGQRFVRFPNSSLTQDTTQVGPFDLLDATKLHNLAGKYRVHFGVPFDLEDIKDSSGIDITTITHVRIIDVVGSIFPVYATFDTNGNAINDPWPTPFPSSGFDLDGVGVIHQKGMTTHTFHQQIEISVLPHPATPNAVLKITGIDNEEFTLEWFTTTGIFITKKTGFASSPVLWETLPKLNQSGTYILSLQTPKGVMLIKKIHYVE